MAQVLGILVRDADCKFGHNAAAVEMSIDDRTVASAITLLGIVIVLHEVQLPARVAAWVVGHPCFWQYLQ